jgi:hypothetical protein
MEMHGDIEGALTVIQHSDWTLPDGLRCGLCGGLSGPLTAEVTRFMGFDVAAPFEGQLGSTIHQGFARGTTVLHGGGDLDGLKVRLTFEGILGGPYAYEGAVVNPISR